MDNNFSRKKIADGVHISRYKDERFKINRVELVFVDTIAKESASLNALIPAVLSRSNDNFRTFSELDKKLSGLYSANLGDYVQKNGDTEFFGISTAFLDDEYALDGESVLTEIMELLRDCIFNPYLENGIFPEKSIELQKQNLIDDNDNEFNDKALYTNRKGMAETYKGEPAELSVYGENSDIEKITPAAAYEHYLKLLSTKNIEIICVGKADFSVVENIFSEAFSKIQRSPEAYPKSSPSHLKAEPANASEAHDVAQSKLLLSFKTNLDSPSALFLTSHLYGGDVSSKLFTVVREKLSLCYYCYSSYDRQKRTLTVNCGVDTENIQKAKAAVLEQLDEVKKGNFTDDDLSAAKLSTQNLLSSVVDSQSRIAGWIFSCILYNDYYTPAEEIKRRNMITREEIIRAANSLKLDTVFILTSREANE